MKASDLDLIAAALNFAHWNKEAFQAFYRDQGHPETAANADRLDSLRQDVNQLHHEALDAEWEEKKRTT